MPNPFYVLLLAASIVFVVTCFAYLISPTVLEQARNQRGAATPSQRFAAWLDRNGPVVLGVEFLVMLVAGGLAMGTDRWFPEKPAKSVKRAGPEA
jgi:hypothetical protein